MKKLNVRMVITPYLSGLNAIIEWSQYHIRVVQYLIQVALITIVENVILESLTTVQYLIAQLSLNLFYLETEWLIVCCAQFYTMSWNILKNFVSQHNNNFDRLKFIFKIDFENSNIKVWKPTFFLENKVRIATFTPCSYGDV